MDVKQIDDNIMRGALNPLRPRRTVSRPQLAQPIKRDLARGRSALADYFYSVSELIKGFPAGGGAALVGIVPGGTIAVTDRTSRHCSLL